ncbi:endonuclease domain-containing protein [Fretibacter rubidus]|uniref:endonuclease domain-containing protein n=1 Tax=Fretibacter rubidus TaxID=570162 RepID=UPI00352B2B94
MLRTQLISTARRLRRDATPAEVKLWAALRDFKPVGFHFRRQVPMGDYIVDFACHSAKVVIEVDGEHHALEPQKSKDVQRDHWLTEQGYRVVRYWNDDIMTNLDNLMDALLHTLDTGHTS